MLWLPKLISRFQRLNIVPGVDLGRWPRLIHSAPLALSPHATGRAELRISMLIKGRVLAFATDRSDRCHPRNLPTSSSSCEGLIGLVRCASKPARNERPRSSYSV